MEEWTPWIEGVDSTSSPSASGESMINCPTIASPRLLNNLDEELLPFDVTLEQAMDNNASNCFQWLQDVIFDNANETDLGIINVDDSRYDSDWRMSDSLFPSLQDPMLDTSFLLTPEIHDSSFDVHATDYKFQLNEERFDTNGNIEKSSPVTQTSPSGQISLVMHEADNASPTLPRFSVRLTWNGDDESIDNPMGHVNNSNTNFNLTTDDVYQEPIRSDVNTGSHTKSIPQSNADSMETLYSNLPDYYTALGTTSPTEVCFDKLPSYITGIQGSSGYNPMSVFGEGSQLRAALLAAPNVKRGVGSNYSSVYNNDIGRSRNVVKVNPPTRRSSFSFMKKTNAAAGSFKRLKQKKRCASSRSPSRSSRSSSSSSSLSSSSSSSSNSSVSSDVNVDEQCTEKRTFHPMLDSRRKIIDDWPRDRGFSRVRDNYDIDDDEKKKHIEDRRVVHVGNIKPGTTRSDLQRQFGIFGPIQKITMHRRKYGDRLRDYYAFVTYLYKVDAFEALEHGNDFPGIPKYELSLGGRRLFCLENYSDLDSLPNRGRQTRTSSLSNGLDFDTLLNAAKSQIKSNS